MDTSLLASQGFLGLRCVRIPRSQHQHGFGFTLRHFIVYPPELYSEDGVPEGHGYENGIGQTRLHKVTEPVDTIFVKSVKEHSPAELAGLCVGDRIVSVNGESVTGKSYDTVVSLIQKTRELLRLEVSPKIYDTLQLFYEEQAYRPETNQRPYETPSTTNPPLLPSEPLYHYPIHNHHHPHHQQQHHHQGNSNFHSNDYVYPNRSYDSSDYARLNNNMSSSSHSSQTPAQIFSHLPRPVPYKSSAVWASTSSSSARNGSGGNPSSSSLSNKTSQRPPQPQGYYPFNHSFEKSGTLWRVRERDEPNSGAKSADSIFGESHYLEDDSAVYRSPLRSESMECLSDINTNSDKSWKKAGPGYRYSISTAKALGSGTSQPSSDFRNTMVVTMSSTNSSGQTFHNPHDPGYPERAPLVGLDTYTDRIRKSCEQKEEFLKRPNQPFWGSFVNQPPPLPYPKELYAQPQKFTKLPWPPETTQSAALSTTQQPVLQSSVIDSSSSSRNMTNRTERRTTNSKPTATNNVTVISVQHSGPDSLSSGSSSRPEETSNSDSWFPVEHQPESHNNRLEKQRSEPYSSSDLLSMYELPKNRTMVVGSTKLHCDPPPHWKPDLSSLTTYENPQPSIHYSRSVDNSNVFLPSPGSIETEINVQSNNNTDNNVILRKKELEPESESERLVRRVSYLKATSSPIDMEQRKSTSPTSPVKSPTTEELGFSKSDKLVDSSEFIRGGKIHFKIRIGENKRGNYNRSWRQGFAQVRRSGYLYLSKERQPKEAVTGNEESVIISVSIRDGVLIEYAEDYTKRKNVLRIRTFVLDDDPNVPLSINSDNYQQNSNNFTPTISNLSVELLLQCEDQNDLTSWFKCLQKLLENNNLKTDSTNNPVNSSKAVIFGSEFCPKSKSFFTSLLPSPGTPGQSSSANDKTGNASSSLIIPGTSNTLAPNSAGGLNTAASPKVKTWKGKVAKQWKKVHDIIDTTGSDTKASSPYASLPPAGATFGINLENCPPGENNPFIPRVIEYSIELVERKGIEMVGLYRIPGNNASVALLTDRLNRGEDPNPEKDSRWLDVHVVASLIKSFLRRLPDPLLTNDRYPAFIQAADEEEEICLAKTKHLIQSLPKHNYETLKAVVMHLKHVAEKGEVNRMDARNLAIVFGPTIVRTAGENFSSMVADMKNQCKIVEALVLHADEFFDMVEDKQVTHVLRNVTEENVKSVDEEATQQESPRAILTPSTPPESAKDELKASILKAAKRKVSAKENQPLDLSESPTTDSKEGYKPVDEKGFIRSYAGLNEVTERRVRNFELETKAMLHRDDRSPNASVINVGVSNKTPKTIDDIKQQKIKLEDDLKKAKDDLETEDIYDKIADNPGLLVHHRERTLGMCASNPGPFNLSNSSLSSSNSNSTAPSLLTSSLPAWPTAHNRLGAQPFRNSMPPQSLPPKPPTIVATNSSSLNSSFEIVPASSVQSDSSIRRVNSIDRLQGMQSSSISTDASIKFDKLTNKESFKRLRRPDGRLLANNPKQLGGSLDSLNDINSRLQSSKVDDLSPRSSDGSDMVTTLTKTLDKKLQNLRTQFSGTRRVADENEHYTNTSMDKTADSNEQTIKHNDPIINENSTDDSHSRNHFLKKGRRRHSLIERRKFSMDKDDKTRENHSATAKNSNSHQKLSSKDCRRRHSLSGATEFFVEIFRGSDKLSVHRDRDSEQKNNKTLSSEALLSALKNASILESHV